MLSLKTSLVLALVSITFATGEAWARTPGVDEMEKIKELTVQLKIDADDAYVEAAKNAGNGNAEVQALKNLFALKQSSEKFNATVQQNLTNPGATTQGFDKLNRDYIAARDDFTDLSAYKIAGPLFETLTDTMGNLRHYYVSPNEYTYYADYNKLPSYPGVTSYVYTPTPAVPYYYRYPYYWHGNPYYYSYYPYRVNYRWGYGAYPYHYGYYGYRPWYR